MEDGKKFFGALTVSVPFLNLFGENPPLPEEKSWQKKKMGDRLVWKRGRESQNETGPSSSGKFETADKTSGHVSIQPDDFSRTVTHYSCPFRENRKIWELKTPQ